MADAEPTIRRATAGDGDAIGRVQVETWRAAYRDLLPDEVVEGFDVDERQRLWRDGLSRPRRPGSETLVAEVDGAVVGFTSVGVWRGGDEPEEGVAELFTIYVEPAYWGTGVGLALIERAEASMRESCFVEARLWVLDGNERAERFCRAAGWERDGRKIDDFQGGQIAEARYSKRL